MDDVKKHDYRTGRGKGVELIVRPHNKYGAALPGERVLVDCDELKSASTMSACMTEKQSVEISLERSKRAQEIADKKAKGSPVQASIRAAIDQITERSVRLASEKAAREQLDAEADAVAG